MPLLEPRVAPSVWLGHAANVIVTTTLSPAWSPERRFTLFPPELIGNLYVGPIDNTMAGPP
jgi:hypothetical protein